MAQLETRPAQKRSDGVFEIREAKNPQTHDFNGSAFQQAVAQPGQGDISKPTLFAIKLSTLGTHDGYKHLRDERKEGHSNANFRNLDGQLVRR